MRRGRYEEGALQGRGGMRQGQGVQFPEVGHVVPGDVSHVPTDAAVRHVAALHQRDPEHRTKRPRARDKEEGEMPKASEAKAKERSLAALRGAVQTAR